MTDPIQTIHYLPFPPARPLDAHKGTFGTVIVVGGSSTMLGAPALAATSALRCGVGLVKIASQPNILPHIICIEPSATGIALEGSLDNQIAAIARADPDQRAVLAIGPGLGIRDEGRQLLGALLRGRRTIVLDADGLNLLVGTGMVRPGNESTLVLTPHPGEFKRLAEPLGIRHSPTDPQQRPEAAAALARAHHAIVVLKGPNTVVSDGQRQFINRTGNPALATAGSGDVLTGMIAAFIAQGMDAIDATILAVFLHGRAADRWAHQHGPSGMLARDLVERIPDTIQALRAAAAAE